MNGKLGNYILLLIWVSLMASSFIVSEDLLPYANSIVSTALRFLIAAILMLPLLIINGFKWDTLEVYSRYFVISIFLVAFFVGLFEALKTTTALRASLIYTLVPLISVILSFIVFNNITPWFKLFGFVVGSIGAATILLATNAESVNLSNWNFGDGLFLIACSCLSMHVQLVKEWGRQVPALQGAFYIMLFGGLSLIPLVAYYGDVDNIVWANSEFWKTILYLILFTTMATFFLQQHLIQTIGPNQLMAFTYLIPILVALPEGVLMAAKIEVVLAGILITLLALYLISKEQSLNL